MFDAAMTMLSPVRGFRPRCADRDFVHKVPKPAIRTVSPLAGTSAIVDNMALKAAPALGLDMEVWAAKRAEGSALCIRIPHRGPIIVAYHATDNCFGRQHIPRDGVLPAVVAPIEDVPQSIVRGSPPL